MEILAIIIPLLALLSIIMLIKRLFKPYLILNLLILIILFIFGFLIYKDLVDIRERFGSSANIVLLEENNRVLTGFIIMNGKPELLSEENIEQYSTYLANKDYSIILSDNYKLILVKIEAISKIREDKFVIDEKEFSKEEILRILKSPNNIEYKAAAFSFTFSNYISSQQNMLYFLEEYKNGDIFIYPETAVFKFIKLVPSNFIKSGLQRSLQIVQKRGD